MDLLHTVGSILQEFLSLITNQEDLLMSHKPRKLRKSRSPRHHYKKRKMQVRRLEEKLYGIYGEGTSENWEVSDIFEFSTPLIRGTPEYDQALVWGMDHMQRPPDIILKTFKDEETLEYVYWCCGTEPLRVKFPITDCDEDVAIFQHPGNLLKMDTSSYESDEANEQYDNDQYPSFPESPPGGDSRGDSPSAGSSPEEDEDPGECGRKGDSKAQEEDSGCAEGKGNRGDRRCCEVHGECATAPTGDGDGKGGL